MIDTDISNKIRIAIDRLKSFEPEEGYFLAFSGGKDSQCIYHLAEMSGVKFEAGYQVTSVDPPELVRFIKDNYPTVKLTIPHDKDGNPMTMWNLIKKFKLPPTRIARYCCKNLKETSGVGRVTITGVRWEESANRKNNQGLINIRTRSKKLYEEAGLIDGADIKEGRNIILNDDNDDARRMVEQCFRTRKTLVNPIVDWTEEEVWEFLNNVVKVPHCELYDQGYTRLGCIGCPMNTHRGDELEKYPAYKNSYLRAFDKMIKLRIDNGLDTTWETAEEVMNWWLAG